MKDKPYEVYSFDVFDTVITRCVGAPRSLFLLLGEKLEAAETPEAFYHARISAEKQAYRNHAPASQPSLAEIYEQLQYGLGLSHEDAQKIMRQEMLFEKQVIRPIAEVMRKIAEARARGGRIVFVSDMYLPENFLREVLENLEIMRSEDRLYVSCEHKVSKHNGKLFKKVLSDYGIGPKQMLHCGNDAVADIAVPKALGIRIAPFVKANLNRYENLMEAFALKTMGSASLMAGASRMSRLGQDANDAGKSAITDVAAGVVAPLLVSYVLWIFEQARKQKLKRLYFVSRDGQILLGIAKILQRRLKTAFDLRYLYGGRQAWHLPALTDFGEIERRWIRDSWGVDLASMFRRVDIEPESIETLLRKYGIAPSDFKKPAERLRPSQIRDLFEDQEMQRLILERGASKRPALEAYFKQEGLFEDIAYGLVDLGWEGKMRHSFNKILKGRGQTLPPWFFLGAVKRFVRQDEAECHTFMFDEGRKLGFGQLTSRSLPQLEVFCSGDHSIVLGYRSTPEGVVPELSNSRNEPAERWGLPLYRETVLSFTENLPLARERISFTGWRELSFSLFEEFQTNPTSLEARVWGGFPYDFDQTGTQCFRIAYRLGLKEFFYMFLFGKVSRDGDSVWLKGCYRLTPDITVFFIRAASYLHRNIWPVFFKRISSEPA